jgi:hypothetical protein
MRHELWALPCLFIQGESSVGKSRWLAAAARLAPRYPWGLSAAVEAAQAVVDWSSGAVSPRPTYLSGWRIKPVPKLALGCDYPPLGQGGRASLLVLFSAAVTGAGSPSRGSSSVGPIRIRGGAAPNAAFRRPPAGSSAGAGRGRAGSHRPPPAPRWRRGPRA